MAVKQCASGDFRSLPMTCTEDARAIAMENRSISARIRRLSRIIDENHGQQAEIHASPDGDVMRSSR